ncbi:MAG TPA: hypothetical protein VHG72_18850 [Polyangia bacterium]|nr:hypothetical protein [Polyangia bacterium]
MTRTKLVPTCVFLGCFTLAACGTNGSGDTGTGGSAMGGSGDGSGGVGDTTGRGGSTATGGSSGLGGSVGTGGSTAGTGGSGTGTGGAIGTGGSGAGGSTGTGGAGTGGKAGSGGATGSGGAGAAGHGGTGGSTGTGGTGTGGKAGTGGATSTGGTTGTGGSGSCTTAPGSEIGTFTDPTTSTNIAPPDPPGIGFKDTQGNLVDAHGGGIIKVCDTYYLHGEYFSSTTTDNDFNGFSMYSSKDMATWKNEGIFLPQQASGLLGPSRKGERPHIVQCPSTGEFVMYAHAADTTYQVDKEVVYATAPAVTGPYTFKGVLASTGASSTCTVTSVPPSSCSGSIAAHSDMSALSDGNNAYVVTESGWVYTLASDCHSWSSAKQYSAVNGTSGGIEAPTVFKAGSTWYWIGSSKTGWRANDDFYSTAPAITGPWTYQGYLAPEGKLTWMTQSTWVQPIVGTQGTTYVYWGDHWYGNQDTTAPGKHNNLATYVFQPLVFTGTLIGLPTYEVSWKLDVGAGTWTKN